MQVLIRFSNLCNLLFLLFFIAAAIPNAFAEPDIFNVQNIYVDETAATPTDSRDKAIETGERLAFKQLLAALSSQTAVAQLPELSSDALARVVKSFEITHEKITGNRYQGRMNVSFNEEEVRIYLNSGKLAGGGPDAKSPPVLIIPIYQTGGQNGGKPILWEIANPWRDAWNKIATREGTLHLVQPLGDAEDAVAVNVTDLENESYKSLYKLANKYGAKEIIIAWAKYVAKNEDGKPVFEIKLQSVGEASTLGNLSGFSGAYPASDSLYDAAVSDIVTRLNINWIRRHKLEDVMATGKFRVTIAISSLQNWLAIRSKLESFASIKRLDVLQLSPDKAVIDIAYKGKQTDFIDALDKNGFQVFEDKNGSDDKNSWVMRLK